MTAPYNNSTDNLQLLSSIFEAKKILFIGAHPDDIEFYCGALVYMLRQRGVDVTFAIATKGGKGRSGKAKARLENIRSRHALDAAEILGGANVVLHDYPDKSLSDFIEQFTEDLKSLIVKEKPDIIFSWDSDFIYNPHPDHQAAALSGKKAAKNCKVCYYGTREPNLLLNFNEDIFNINLKSVRAHRTETPWYYYPLVKRVLRKRLAEAGKIINAKYAEAFRTLV